MRPSEVIREGRNILFERGWHKGGYEGPDGSVCVVGACRAALLGDACLPTSHEQSNDFTAIFDEALGGGWREASEFNDSPSTTFDDVIELLDRAEKIAEQHESARGEAPTSNQDAAG
jgi:hypothetical protein